MASHLLPVLLAGPGVASHLLPPTGPGVAPHWLGAAGVASTAESHSDLERLLCIWGWGGSVGGGNG